jgi:hypothetical protein
MTGQPNSCPGNAHRPSALWPMVSLTGHLLAPPDLQPQAHNPSIQQRHAAPVVVSVAHPLTTTRTRRIDAIQRLAFCRSGPCLSPCHLTSLLYWPRKKHPASTTPQHFSRARAGAVRKPPRLRRAQGDRVGQCAGDPRPARLWSASAGCELAEEPLRRADCDDLCARSPPSALPLATNASPAKTPVIP